MPTEAQPAGVRLPSLRGGATRATRVVFTSLEQLAGGLGTGVLALVTVMALIGTALLYLVGLGPRVLPGTLRLLRQVADRERARLSRWGSEIINPGPAREGLRAALTDRVTRRELGWAVLHGTVGVLLSGIALTLPINAVRDATYPLWWWLPPDGAATAFGGLATVRGWPGAFAVALAGPVWLAALAVLGPVVARLQARPGRRLLTSDVDLSLRVAQLTATRAAALDAHAAELRRIERSLHDGTQNRMVAVTVLLGAARRALARDPAGADDILERAQHAAEQALAELRTVARGILPPVLADRGLAGALAGLATDCPVPCRIDVDVPGRCATSVEATAYFVVAEALTNVSRHSRARSAAVVVVRRGGRLHVTVSDDGRGGADATRGSGLSGIRRRVEAHDGNLTVTSPDGGPTTLKADLPCGS